MIAALPMYDFPWTAPALDTIWADIGGRLRGAGVAAPERLTRGGDLNRQWRDPGLVFGQTCGYPYRQALRDVVEILATPVFAFDGCDGAAHCSLLVVRRDDARADLAAFRGARAAINGGDSNTGMNLFRAAIAPLARAGRFFGSLAMTGAHIESLAAISRSEADIAAIDCVTFGLVARGAPERLVDLRVLARTPSSPGLPFIASRALPKWTRALAREALFAALDEPALAEAWRTLGVAGAEVLADTAYARVNALEMEAGSLGYPELH